MKNLLLFLFISITISSCNNDDDNTPQNPVDQLPPPTTTGENTFGFMVNGEPVSISNTTEMAAIYQGGLLQLGADYEIEDIDRGVTIWLERENLVEGSYFLNGNTLNIAFFKESISECTLYETFSPNSGSLKIDFIDHEQFIVSGRFEFEAVSPTCEENITITNGRFDMQYIP